MKKTKEQQLHQPEPSFISTEYETELQARHGDAISSEIAHNWRYAELPDSPGEQLPYIRLNEGASEKPVLYIPGFTEGIVSKAPFAAELAGLGNDVIMPDQNRKKILKDAANKKDATYSQAMNYLAVIEAEGLENVDIVTHSYGSLIFDKMQEIAADQGKSYFDDANVVMLAPAGFSKEKIRTIGKRFMAVAKSEGKGNPKDFPDTPEMLKAGIKNFTANIPRAVGEVRHLAKNQVDYKRLLESGIANLAVVSYAEDRLYSDKVIESTVNQATQAGASWVVPISQKERFDPDSAKPHATHNDEQFNPYRVAATVDEILNQG